MRQSEASCRLELAEKDREMLAATNQLRHDAAQRMQQVPPRSGSGPRRVTPRTWIPRKTLQITAENDTKLGELQRAHELEVRRCGTR